MINMENYDEDLLEEAVVFKNTGRQANRIKCATLSANGIKEFLVNEIPEVIEVKQIN